jgi:hypothetical protein
MEARNNVLRRELDRAGFCYDAIGLIEGHCAKWLRDAADDIAAMERITLFVMVRICFSIKELLESNPTTEAHHRLEAALRPALTRAIDSLNANDQAEQTEAISELIAAFLAIR